MVTVCKNVVVELDIDISDFEDDVMVDELESRGFKVVEYSDERGYLVKDIVQKMYDYGASEDLLRQLYWEVIGRTK